jgi:hypothetical protein
MKNNQGSIGIFMALMCVGLSTSCSGHDSNRAAATPTSTATAYLGIQKMWRGHVVSINRNVLVVWVEPHLQADPYDTANYVLGQLEPAMVLSDLQIVVIKVSGAQGIVSTSESYVFVKDAYGRWGRINDKTMLDNIIRAGL